MNSKTTVAGTDSPRWTELVQDVRNKFGITATGAERGIEHAMSAGDLLALRRGQSAVMGRYAQVEFRSQDVEPLLDQACIILDKALADLTTAQTLGEKFATLKCDLDQSIILDAILQREEADKKFAVDEAVCESQRNANGAKIAELEKAYDWRMRLGTRLSGDLSAEASARAGAIANVRAQYGAKELFEGQVYSPVPDGTPSGREGQKKDIDVALTTDQYLYEIANELHAIAAAQWDTWAELEVARKVTPGLTAQMEWAKKNTNYLSERALRVREVLQYKVALTGAGDLLDFAARMKVVKDRYQQQLAAAYCRLQKVEKGLAQIYKYVPGGLPDPLPPLGDEVGVFEEILAWTRRVAAWLAALTRRSHNYVLPISIRRLCRPDWQSGVATGEWSFRIENDLFSDNERHVRIRGVCAWCSGKEGPYSIDLTPPKSTWNRYEFDPKPFPDVQFDQDVTRCRVGRVVARQDAFAPEVSGITALYNASPFGDWTIKASDPIGIGAWPDDFHVELYLSVLAVKS